MIKVFNEGIFLEHIARQGIKDTPQGHVNFIPLLGFDKAHLVEDLGLGCHRLKCLGLGVLARLSGQLHQLGTGLAVLIGCLFRSGGGNMSVSYTHLTLPTN